MDFKEINDTKWDKLVASLPHYSFLLSNTRLKTLKYKNQKIAIYKNDKFIGVCPYQIRRTRFGKYLFSQNAPSFADYSLENLREVINFLRKQAIQHDCDFIRISPLIKNTDKNRETILSNIRGSILSPVHNIDGLVTQIINLQKDKKQLLKDMRSSSKRKIKKLKKNKEVSTQVVDNLSEFKTFAKLHQKTCVLKGYSTAPILDMKEEYEMYAEDQMFYSILGKYKNQVISIWNLIRYKNTLLYYHGASDLEYRNKNLNMSYLIFWEAVKLGKKLECKKLDLYGGLVPKRVNKENHPWKGIDFFKKGFGGETIEYIHPIDIPIRRLKYWTMIYPYFWLKERKNGYPIKW
jgi:lipid II:glycine glycyltransferase (peptidoglycan interpeptide bridge formation enzyme)